MSFSDAEARVYQVANLHVVIMLPKGSRHSRCLKIFDAFIAREKCKLESVMDMDIFGPEDHVTIPAKKLLRAIGPNHEG
jgi:hypothetical protein